MLVLTSLPAAVLVVGGLALALLVAIGGRLVIRALIPAADRDGAYAIAAPLMPALGAAFAILMVLSLASEASFLSSALTNDRRARLAAASHQLPALYAVVLALTGVALILNAAALTLRSGLRPALLISGLTVVIGLSLALLFALGTPWRGAITVSGQPIDTVARDLNAGYFHP